MQQFRYYLLFIALLCPLFLVGQDVILEINSTPSTCFANGTITITLMGSDMDSLSQINYKVKNIATGDERLGVAPQFKNLSKGDYLVSMDAFFQETPIQITDTTTVDGDYTAPTAFKVNSDRLIGTRKTFNCKNSGRVSLLIEGGVFPYMVETYLNSSLFRVDTFNTHQNSGTSQNMPDYKDYYNFEELPAGNFLFKIKDGCDYGLPNVSETVETLWEDYHCYYMYLYVSNYFYDYNIVHLLFHQYYYYNDYYWGDLYKYYYDQAFRNIPWWEYTYSSGEEENDWEDIPPSWQVFDTVNVFSSDCDPWSKEYLVKIRVKDCDEIACSNEFAVKLNPYLYVNMETYVNAYVENLFDPVTGCGSEVVVDEDEEMTLKLEFWGNFFIPPVHFIVTHIASGEVWLDTMVNASSFRTDTLIHRNHVGEILHFVAMYGDSCILFDYEYAIPPPYIPVVSEPYWYNPYYSQRTCDSIFDYDYIHFIWTGCGTTNNKPPENTVINLIESPDNYLSFTGIYNRSLDQWNILYDNMVLDTAYSPYSCEIYFQAGKLISGTYLWVITDDCGRADTIQTYYWFADFYDYEIEESLTFESQLTCEGEKYLPKVKLVGTRRIDGYKETMPVYYYVNGIPGGCYPTSGVCNNDFVTFTIPGNYQLSFGATCLAPPDTIITYIYKGLVLLKAYGYACNDGVNEVSKIVVEVDSTTGVAPYGFDLYTLNGDFISSNNTGIFYEGTPDSTFLVIITDQCGTTYSQNIKIERLMTGRVAFAKNSMTCLGDTIGLYVVSFLGDQVEFHWEGPNNFFGQGREIEISNASPEHEGYYIVYITGLECFIIDSIYISIVFPVTTYISDTICFGASYTSHGFTILPEEIPNPNSIYHFFQFQKTMPYNCDSIIVLTLIVNPVYETHIFGTVGYGGYNFFGEILHNAGTYTHTLQAINNCDSIIVLTLTLKTYTITVIPYPPGWGNACCNGIDIPYGNLFPISATPNECYSFVGWFEADTLVTENQNYIVEVDTSRTFIAIFEPFTHNIALSVNPPEVGIVEGGGNRPICKPTIVTAITVDPCYKFVNWTEDGEEVSTDSSYLFIVTAPRNLVANFELKKFNIFTQSNPTGGGSTQGGGTDIPCDSTVCIIAIPEFGYKFVNWTAQNGQTSTNNPHCFQVWDDNIWTANFELKTYTIITLSNPPYGGTTEGSGNYTHGDTVTVKAFPEDCYVFVNWMINNIEVSTNNPYIFAATSSLDTTYLVANFERKIFSVFAIVNPTGSGTVSVSESGNYYCGDTSTVIAIPEECYHFVSWTIDDIVVSTQPIYQFLVTGMIVLVANFAIDTCEITLVANPTTGGTLFGTGTYLCGQPAVAMAFTDPCYTFINWTKNGDTVSWNEIYPFTVEENCTLIANFEQKYFYITVSPDPPDGGLALESGYYPCGDTGTFCAVEFPDYDFIKWTEDNVFVSDENCIIFEVTGDRELVAHFTLKSFEVIVSANPPKGGTVTGGGVYNIGDTATVTATPNPNGCYQFFCWQENGNCVSVELSHSFPVTGNHELVAIFEVDVFEISLSANPPEGGAVAGGGTYNCGDTATVTATPIDECWKFVCWTTENGDIFTDNPLHFEVTEDYDLVAIFIQKIYNITIVADPLAGGTVSVGDTTIACVSNGTFLTVEAFPEECYTFTGWWTQDGDFISISNPYTFNVTKSDTLVAQFEINSFTVNLSALPITGGGVSGGGNYNCGDTATVTATPNDCWTFIGWWTQEGNSVSTDNPYTFVVAENINLVAYFIDSVKVTIITNPPGVGTVTGSGFYICYETVTVAATLIDDCYTFVNWTNEDGDTLSSNNPYLFTVIESQTLIANFVANTFNVYVIASPTAGGTVSGGGNYICGDTSTVTAIPANCYHFVNWTINNIEVSTQPLYEFPVTGTTVLVANFAIDTCVITLVANPPTGGTLLGTGTYECGQPAVAMAFTDPCYTFINWTKNGDTVSWDEIYPFTVEETCILIANFERNNYYIAVSPDPPNGGLAIESGYYYCGDTVTLSAIPFSDYDFIEWRENNVFVSDEADFSFEITEPRELVAHFALITYEVTVEIEPEAACSNISGAGIYNLGDTATVTVDLSSDCCNFIGWKENGDYVSDQSSHSFSVTGNHHLVAVFEVEVFEITLSTNPSDGGDVTGGGNYNCGDTITVTATSAECYTFVNWTDENGEVYTGNPLYFEVTEDLNLTANFELTPYNITVIAKPSTGGTVSGGGDIPCDSLITVTAIPDSCYTFAGWWTLNGSSISTNNPYTFNVIKSDTLVAHFEIKRFTINLSAFPSEGGGVSGGSTDIHCDSLITITATSNDCWAFVGWRTQNGDSVSTKNPYIFNVRKSENLVAHFEWINYEIILSANPPDGGIVASGGNYVCGDTITISATSNQGFKFEKWTTVDGSHITYDPVFDITVNSDNTFVAHFTQSHYRVTVLINDTLYGTTDTKGTVLYEAGSIVRIIAYEKNCYSFINWTAINGEQITINNIYEFIVTKDTTLIANFSALDFDTYCPTLWCNTFMLDLHTLRLEYGEIENCEWYIDGAKVRNTQTINQFSYSAGPNFDDRLMCGVEYMFKLKFKNRTNWLCSSLKVIKDNCCNLPGAPPKNLVVFPNPTRGDNSFTVENVIPGEAVQIFNQYGIYIKSAVATGEAISMTLSNVSSGVYMIRCGERFGKIVIIR
ncbi:MAG: InlB B-repeat-containing protein [Lentimicrobiaceae bacterium]|nr:InlB B-repeat-containing protein [Lentimicrobiaceae bacterium]